MPASEELIMLFVAAWAGKRSRSCVDSWVAGIHAWHSMHGALWSCADGTRLVKQGVSRMVPASSKRESRPPVTADHLLSLRNHLDMSDTFDSAVWACATTTFFGVSRLGIFCPSAAVFDHTKFAKRADINFATDPQGNEYFSVHAPWTKTEGYKGATILVSKQEQECDPVNAAVHHIIINNNLPSSAPLFSFATASGWSPMRKDWFLNRCNAVWKADGLLRITGHSFRIGGATELLTRGVPPEIVAKQGHWRSDAFLRYWRRIELVLPQWTASPHARFTGGAIAVRVADWMRRLASPRSS